MIRLFVGIALPENIVDRLMDLQTGLPDARWVEADNLHITLRFIGEVDEGKAADIDEMLSEIRAPAFDVSVAGTGRFGDRRRVRSVWVGVEPTPDLQHLHDKVESACVRAGLPPEGRKFRPHVTLARFSGNASSAADAMVAEYTGWVGGDFHIEEFTLFSSRLGRHGAQYTRERDYSLISRAERSAGVPS
jgi:2'-5' RNA ligase